MVTYCPFSYSWPETIWSSVTAPWIGHIFLYLDAELALGVELVQVDHCFPYSGLAATGAGAVHLTISFDSLAVLRPTGLMVYVKFLPGSRGGE